jgi:hypothetical protein
VIQSSPSGWKSLTCARAVSGSIWPYRHSHEERGGVDQGEGGAVDHGKKEEKTGWMDESMGRDVPSASAS